MSFAKNTSSSYTHTQKYVGVQKLFFPERRKKKSYKIDIWLKSVAYHLLLKNCADFSRQNSNSRAVRFKEKYVKSEK